MNSSPLGRGALLSAVSVLLLTLGACSSDRPGDGTTSGDATQSAAAESTGPTESGAAPASDQPFGPGCSAMPAAGEGSFAGMADDPVATAASHNPALSTLVQAITAASLGAGLDGQQAITVLAPANQAFEALPPDALQGLLADTAQLTAVLTHHVIAGRLPPEQLAGTHTTLNNDQVTIEGADAMFTVPAPTTLTGTEATVICGNVQTANATVYVIDQVLAPPAG